MRPLLGLGDRCRLEEACQYHGIDYKATHIASDDAMASAKLLNCYLNHAESKGVATFGDFAKLKIINSSVVLILSLFQTNKWSLKTYKQLLSRAGIVKASISSSEQDYIDYMDALKTAVVDLDVSDCEVKHLMSEKAAKLIGSAKECPARAIVCLLHYSIYGR